MSYTEHKSAFTMIEVVFVIVVLGILAAIAVPRFSATRDDAIISKGRSDIASIRSGIITERQNRLIKGDTKFITGTNLDTTDGLFGGVLSYGVISGKDPGHWENTKKSDATNTYKYHVTPTSSVTFTYTRSSGKFTCDTSNATCLKLVK